MRIELASEILELLEAVAEYGLLTTDDALIVTGWNQWLEQRTGFTAEKVLGRSLVDLFPELATRKLDRYYQQALTGQTVILSQRFHRYLIPIPTTTPQFQWLQQSAKIVPLLSVGGVKGTLTVIEDVTERVVYEAELRDRANQQETLAALTRTALAGSDITILAREVVRRLAELFNADAIEILERHKPSGAWAELASQGWSTKPVSSTIRTDAVTAAKTALVVSDVLADARLATDDWLRGHEIRSVLAIQIPSRAEQPYGLIGVYTRSSRHFSADEVQLLQAVADVFGVAAERKYLEDELRERVAELRERDRLKDEFLAMLAHELRNPLAPLSNALHLLGVKCATDVALRPLVDIMSRQTEQLSRLTDDLLEVSRLTIGKITLRKEQVELSTIVAQVLETTLPLVESRRHQLHVSQPSEPIVLEADAGRLAQVFSNLLNNAAKYSAEGSPIWLTVSRSGNEAVISVRDVGVGIAPELLERVFDLFAQVDSSLDRSQGGLGIGLTLVRGLVEMHQGRVQALSEGLGKGSEFVIRLPVLAVNAKGNNVEAVRAPGPLIARKILIVDDSVDSTDSLAMLLRMDGHQVLTAYEGVSALAIAEKNSPEVILLDIGLPKMDGYAVARQIRSHPRLKNALVIAMTGYGHEEHRRSAQEAGFDHHFVKPVDLNQLMQILGRLPKPSSM